MDEKKLASLIKRNEGLKLDFKQMIDINTESGKKELAKDVSAIANSKGGRGYIIIGIEDKTKNIVGIENIDFTEEQIQQIISSRIEPPVPISLEMLKYYGKNLAIINIYDSDQKPYQIRENGVFYIRRGSTTDTMRKEEIISSLQDNLSLNIELCSIVKSDEKDIDISLVDKYFKSIGVLINDDNRISMMEKASIINYDKERGKFAGSLGGLLIFCKENNIFLSHNRIKIINNINKKYDKVNIIQGNLLDIIDKSRDILINILPKAYPIDAICEAINNAVLYRDYSIFYEEIEVLIDYKTISIISPGCLLRDNNMSSFNTLKRNMWIYEKLISLDDKNRFIKSGNGFRRMKKAFRGRGKVIFINSFKENCFKVMFPGINKLYKKNR
ncbi:putative DNA binding domain-containing protein [Clostridium botulinum]|nr:putative DNA binding domain-containing protein [Clostridium botulinum]